MSVAVVSPIDAFAAGALPAMTVETMIPEGAQDGATFNGPLATGGFIAVLLLLAAD